MKRVEVVGKEDVFLGRLGDTEVREFALDISEWKECMDGVYSISCLYVPPKTADNLAYPIAIDHYRVEGDRLVWIPTATECAVIGWAKFEAVLYNENQQVSTLIWRVQIGKSLAGDGDPPEGWENYILAVERLVDEIENMTVSASVDASVGTPSVTVETSGGSGEPFSIDFDFKNLKGNGIVSAELNDDYTLTLDFDEGSYITPSIRGEQGEKGNVMYATFYVDDDMKLHIVTPDEYDGATFILNRNILEVQIA